MTSDPLTRAERIRLEALNQAVLASPVMSLEPCERTPAQIVSTATHFEQFILAAKEN